MGDFDNVTPLLDLPWYLFRNVELSLTVLDIRQFIAESRRMTELDGEFGWGGTSVRFQRRCPTVSSKRTEISCRPEGEKLT